MYFNKNPRSAPIHAHTHIYQQNDPPPLVSTSVLSDTGFGISLLNSQVRDSDQVSRPSNHDLEVVVGVGSVIVQNTLPQAAGMEAGAYIPKGMFEISKRLKRFLLPNCI